MVNRTLTRRTALSLPFFLPALKAAPARRWRAEEVRRYPAPEANQAAAVDAVHFYAIGNHIVGKYDKKSGKRVALWECEKGKPLLHLNSGLVRQGVLYCAHSNSPALPTVSSIEIWDTKELKHTGAHSFGIFAGAATWIDFHKGHWYVTFAHYRNRNSEPGRDPGWTTLIQFDTEWRQMQGWVYPPEVVSRLGDYSISGGVFGPDDVILCTGHDNQELYVLRFPEGGSTLVYEGMFATPNKGQGIAWDPAQPDLMYSIDRAKREVIVARITS
jgi:hypothetical protein